MKTWIGFAILAVLVVGVFDQHREFVKQDSQRDADRKAAVDQKIAADLELKSREVIIANCRQLREPANEECIAESILTRLK